MQDSRPQSAQMLPSAKLLSLIFVLDPKQRNVLLGLKKRGFGQGRWNGFGGKLIQGETMAACAARELDEETSLKIHKNHIQPRGKLKFTMLTGGMIDKDTGKVSSVLHVHLFSALREDTHGEPVETDEMLPKWWSMTELPYDAMWPDDRYWLPILLQGDDVEGDFVLSDENTILQHDVRVISKNIRTT